MSNSATPHARIARGIGEKRAEEQAQAIKNYWAARGYAVEARVTRDPWDHRTQGVGFSVRTNLKNGLPRGYIKKRKPKT